MDPTLTKMLDALGIPYKPRFTIEEVAEILGIRRDQVMHLLKRKQLVGMKSSLTRWGGVFAVDLDNYIRAVNVAKPEIPSISYPSSTQVNPKTEKEPAALAGGSPPVQQRVKRSLF